MSGPSCGFHNNFRRFNATSSQLHGEDHCFREAIGQADFCIHSIEEEMVNEERIQDKLPELNNGTENSRWHCFRFRGKK